MFPQTMHVETVALLSKLNTEYHLDILLSAKLLVKIQI